MADSNRPVRVRFAPSPTGYLHIGGLRTALYNYLFARRHGGTFLLRIEDTDQERFVEGAFEDIEASLRWAGLDYDEGPNREGEAGPYFQSQRKDLYRSYVDRLLDAGHAYYAFDTRDDLQAMRDRLAAQEGASQKYDAVTRAEMTNSFTLSDAEVRARLERGDAYVVRLNVPRGEIVRFNDLVRGWVSFETSTLDDQVLLKSDGLPTYHLANVVDDYLMGISHVIRGEEWLSSTPKHLLLYAFFGWEPPDMAHLPLILDPRGGKLSKRNATEQGIPVFVHEYVARGYEPEAFLNFLAFLGWNPGTDEEVFRLDELVEAFSLDRVSTSGSQFNLDKLTWYNQQYLRALPVTALAGRVRPFLPPAAAGVDPAYLERVVALLHDRISFPRDVVDAYGYLFEAPTTYEEGAVKKRWKDDSPDLLLTYADRLEALPDPFTEESAETLLRVIIEERGAGAGRLIHPARLALSGVSFGPSLFALMEVLGKAECIRRIRAAVQALASSVDT